MTDGDKIAAAGDKIAAAILTSAFIQKAQAVDVTLGKFVEVYANFLDAVRAPRKHRMKQFGEERNRMKQFEEERKVTLQQHLKKHALDE